MVNVYKFYLGLFLTKCYLKNISLIEDSAVQGNQNYLSKALYYPTD